MKRERFWKEEKSLEDHRGFGCFVTEDNNYVPLFVEVQDGRLTVYISRRQARSIAAALLSWANARRKK